MPARKPARMKSVLPHKGWIAISNTPSIAGNARLDAVHVYRHKKMATGALLDHPNLKWQFVRVEIRELPRKRTR